MANTEQLLVRIDATTEQLRRELRRADQSVERGGRSMRRSLSRVDQGFAKFNRAAAVATRAAGAFGIALGGVALANFAKGQLAAADAIGKAAKTASVGTDQLQELRFAFGQLAGTTDRQVDEALRRFNRRLGEGQAGSKEYGDALQDLGVDLRQDTAPALEDVLRRLGQVESDSERARIAAKLFGEDAGPRLAAAMNDGGQAMADLRDRARELGIVLDDEAIKKAEEINDKFDIASRVIGTQFQEAVVGLTPALLAMGDALKRAGEFAAVLFGSGEDSVLQRQIITLQEQSEFLRERLGGAAGQFLSQSQREEIERQLRAVEQNISRLIDRRNELLSPAESRAEVGRPQQLPPLGAVQQPRGPGVVQRASGPGQYVAARRSGFDFEGVVIPPFGEPDTLRGLDEFRAGVEEITRAQRQMEQAGRDASLAMLEGLNRAIVAGDDLRSVLASVVSELARMAVNNPSGLADLFSAGIGALGGGGFNSGASVRAVNTSGPLAGLATGGSFQVGGSGGVDSQLVAFRASPNERVTVETPSQRGGRESVVIQQSITIGTAAGDQALQRLAQRAAETGARQGYESVLRDVQRGGPVSKRLR